MSGRSAALLVVALVVALALGEGLRALPAAASSHTIESREQVFGGLVHETFTVPLGGTAVARGNIVRFDERTEHLELRAVMARDRAAGLESVPSMAERELDAGALAGVNGGFAIPTPPGPSGAPNGYAIAGGRLVGGQSMTRSGLPRDRGAVAVGPDRRIMLDRVGLGAALTRPDGRTEIVDEVNRNPWVAGEHARAGELIAYTPAFGASVPAPAGAVVAEVAGLEPPPHGSAAGAVRAVRTVSGGASLDVPPDGGLLLAHGTAAARLTGLRAGDEVELGVAASPHTTAVERWAEAISGLPAGPLLLRDRELTTRSERLAEAFSEDHIDKRHPRTAIAVTGAGEVLVATVDGRQPGHSAGMTMHELGLFLRRLGARDALALDGGGSTTMTVEAEVRNRISDPQPRAVANGLFVYTDYPFDHSERLAGRDRYATAAAVAAANHPEGARHAFLATGERFPDALAGGPLAADVDGPLLLARSDALPAATADALTGLGVERVTLLGGSSALGPAVEQGLRAAGYEVQRAAGPDRFATAVAIAEALAPDAAPDRVFRASGRDFPDALTAAAPAGRLGAPVLLTRPDALPDATGAHLARTRPAEIVVVGGPKAVAEDVAAAAADAAGGATVVRRSGADRYGTARSLNRWADDLLGGDPDGVVVAQGRNFPDALAGGPLAARRTQPLMIVPPGDIEASAAAVDYLESRRAAGLRHVTLLGGPSALRRYQHWQLDQLVAG